MITARLVGDTELIAKFSGLIRGGIQRNVVREVTKLAIELDRLVKAKLSGPVLNVRSGVLRASTNYRITQTSTEVTATEGTNVKYARLHEFGVPHSWVIRPRVAEALAFEINGQLIFADEVIHPGLPERSFLRSALREMTPKIETDLQEAIVGTVKEIVEQ